MKKETTKAGDVDPTRPPGITPLEFQDGDFGASADMASTLGYKQTAYTSTSALWGMFCLPENPEHSTGPRHGGCIIKTAEFGLMFVQTAEDLEIEVRS